MFQAVQLPAGVTELNARLSDVDGNNFAHFVLGERRRFLIPVLFGRLKGALSKGPCKEDATEAKEGK